MFHKATRDQRVEANIMVATPDKLYMTTQYGKPYLIFTSVKY